MSKTSNRYTVHLASDGWYLCNFDIVWWTEHQDDPSCWSSKRESAKTYTLAQIAYMRGMLEYFQGDIVINPA